MLLVWSSRPCIGTIAKRIELLSISHAAERNWFAERRESFVSVDKRIR